MQRLTAILLLALLLYNAFGYHLLFAYHSEQERVSFLKNMPEDAFQVLKINLAIYTSIPDTKIEYVNEDMTVENKTYHIVKKFIKNDTLNVFYLHNHKQDELRKDLMSIIQSQTSDQSSDHDSPAKKMIKSFLKDYIPNDIDVLVNACLASNPEPKTVMPWPDEVLSSAYLSLSYPPPEIA